MRKRNEQKLYLIFFLFTLVVTYSCHLPDNKIDAINLKLKSADVYITAKDTSFLLTKTQQLVFNNKSKPHESFSAIIIDTRRTFQTIEGFGGALTDAAAETYYKLPKEKQKEVLDAYFSSEKGIGYSLCRTSINSCDFSSESYAYTEVENDTLLKHFSIEKDKKYKIPLIKKALSAAEGNLKLFASPWSPPAWMKTNNDMLHGGKLKTKYYQTWADYYIRFIKEYEKEGVPIWGLTVQNEPMAVQRWESCIYTAEEERDFVKYYLGPTLKKSTYPDVKLIIWDHNRGIMYQRAKTVYDDKEAAKYVWGTGFHWYAGDHFENVKLHNEAFPDKKLLFTEGCISSFNYDMIKEWRCGERYGESIIRDLNNGAVGWVDWNILLDETGGPNHVSNFCFAPIIGDTRNGELYYMNSYYYMGHFSKFIKPGAKRVICSSNDDNLLATAFLNTDGTIAAVILNLTNKNKDFYLFINDMSINVKSLANSIITVVTK